MIGPLKAAVGSLTRPRFLGHLKVAVQRHRFKNKIEPILGGDVEFVGEVDDHTKAVFLGKAAALLFPIDWPERFGLCDDRGNGVWNSGACVSQRASLRP
jgi:hypothetical protein